MNSSTNPTWNFDPIDKMIFEDGLKIVNVFFHKQLDVMLILLSNKKIIERRISRTERLAHASETQLYQHELSRTGIHWPQLDEDVSLRGLLKEEMERAIQATETI